MVCFAFLFRPAFAQGPNIPVTPTLPASVNVHPSEADMIAKERSRLDNLVRKERLRLEDQLRERRKAEVRLEAAAATARMTQPRGQAVVQQVIPPGEFLKQVKGGAAPTGAKTTKAVPSMILMLKPFNQACRVGERFATEVILYSDKNQKFDRINIRISFSPLYVRPIQIFDFPIRSALSKNKPPMSVIGNGVVAYSASFDTPQNAQDEKILLYVLWEGVGTASQAHLTLSNGGPSDSAVYLNKKNLLASHLLSCNATIGAADQIAPASEPKDQMDNRANLIIAQEVGMEVKRGKGVQIFLQGPKKDPQPGEEFTMDVILNNPRHDAFNDLQLAIQFDPTLVRVLDADGNSWIRDGVNISDGHAHRNFPFDIFLADNVQNSSGKIDYHMATGSLRPMGSGSVARIRCMALARGAAEAFTLFPKDETKTWFTDVRAGSVSLLGGSSEAQPKVAAASVGPVGQ